MIVQSAIESATKMNTVLIGYDTDLLILLCYHARLDAYDLYFKPEPKKGSKVPKIWNMKSVKTQLGHAVWNSIFLFMM